MAKIYIHYKCSKVPSLKAARTDLLEVTCAQRLTALYGPMHSFAKACLFLFVICAFHFIEACSASLLLSRVGWWWSFSFDP